GDRGGHPGARGPGGRAGDAARDHRRDPRAAAAGRPALRGGHGAGRGRSGPAAGRGQGGRARARGDPRGGAHVTARTAAETARLLRARLLAIIVVCLVASAVVVWQSPSSRVAVALVLGIQALAALLVWRQIVRVVSG